MRSLAVLLLAGCVPGPVYVSRLSAQPDEAAPAADSAAPPEAAPADVVIGTSADAERLCAETDHVTGALTLTGEELTQVDLPCLVRVGGDLRVEAPGLRRLTLPSLVEVGGDLALCAPDAALGAVELTDLTHVGGDLTVTACDALEALDLRALREVGGGLTVRDAERLTVLSAPGLSRVGRAVILQRLTVLQTFVLTRLTEVGAAGVGPLVIAGNDLLWDLTGLTVLARVRGPLTITDNPSLSAREVAALLGRLDGGVDGPTTVARNGP